jgi:general secretion pathway protein B
MSFILDALKKSENDRQRQSGPAMFEVRVAPPRSNFPSWAIALVALLVVNLGVVGWLMFRKPATAATPPIEPAAAPAPVAAAPQPAPMQPAAPSPPPPQTYAPPATAQTAPPASQELDPTLQDPTLANSGTGYPQRAPAQEERFNNSDGNPDDYAPATEPTGELPLSGRVRRGLDNGLMTYEEAATKNQIPPVRMDLHVYAPDPRRRFVLVNMKRLMEGESLPEGVKVDTITPDGAILSYRGVQFMMERD